MTGHDPDEDHEDGNWHAEQFGWSESAAESQRYLILLSAGSENLYIIYRYEKVYVYYTELENMAGYVLQILSNPLDTAKYCA